jgi:hypothetical protein
MHCRRWASTGLDDLIEDTKYGLDVRRFYDSEAKLAILKFLRRQKNLPPAAMNQKHPGFGRFLPRAFQSLVQILHSAPFFF